MKKVLLCLFCMMFFLQGCGKDHEGEPIELTPQEVLVRLQDPKKNSFMLYITSDNCYSCDEYEKVIQEIEEETPFEIYYLKMDTNEEDTDIKQAVEKMFEGTKVASVNTMNISGKTKRRGYTFGKTNNRKKAIVQLTAESKEIEIFQGM